MKVTYGRRVSGKIFTLTLKGPTGKGFQFPKGDKVTFQGEEYTLIPTCDDLYFSILKALDAARRLPSDHVVEAYEGDSRGSLVMVWDDSEYAAVLAPLSDDHSYIFSLVRKDTDLDIYDLYWEEGVVSSTIRMPATTQYFMDELNKMQAKTKKLALSE